MREVRCGMSGVGNSLGVSEGCGGELGGLLMVDFQRGPRCKKTFKNHWLRIMKTPKTKRYTKTEKLM